MTHQKQFWRSFVPKLESGRKLTSTSCRASSALSNCLCQYFYEFWPPARLFQILYITSTLYKTLVGPIKAVKIVLIPTDSDAVFHEESEYGVGFKIWAKKVGLSSIFRKQFIFFVEKTESAFFVFYLYLCEKRFILKKFITKMISEKFSTNSESFNKFGRGRRIDWRIPVEWPYSYINYVLHDLYFHTSYYECCIY